MGIDDCFAYYFYDTVPNKVFIDRAKNDDNFESFTPSIGIRPNDILWILCFKYTTYDSFGSDDYERLSVVDLYYTKDEAFAAAKGIKDYDSSFYSKKEIKVLRGDGKPLSPYIFGSWGYRLNSLEISMVTVEQSAPEKTRFSFSMYEEIKG